MRKFILVIMDFNLMKIIFEIIKLTAFVWIAQQLVWAGSTWDLIANPIKGVEVVLEDGSHHTGEYYRDWERNHIINNNSGGVISFKEFKVMSFPAKQSSQSSSRWRMYTPVSIFVIISMALWTLNFRNKKTEHPKQDDQ